jgi:hypothetical protein
MPHYGTMPGRYRLWLINSHHLGGTGEESSYELRSLDINDNIELHVPCIILQTHPDITKVNTYIGGE